MNLRHAAALALVGWYLMIPPVEFKGTATIPKSVFVASNAPFSEWEMSGSFDTAKECEAARPAIGTPSDFRHQSADDAAAKIRMSAIVAFAKRYAQCIATDDPRLKGK